MPTTYLLLRNNKETGPFDLDALVQQNLQPHDLIWIEGQSAGWQHPSEINAIKNHLNPPKGVVPVQEAPGHLTTHQNVSDTRSQSSKKATHIFVSLPAGTPGRNAEAQSADALEAKAEALHQRIQAFAQGKPIEEDENIYPARSLNAMKQEYSVWQATQEKKKKNGLLKQRLLIASVLLFVMTSVFGVGRWLSKKTTPSKPSLTGHNPQALQNNIVSQTTTASFNMPHDSLKQTAAEISRAIADTAITAPPRNRSLPNPSLIVKKKSLPAETLVVSTAADTNKKATPPPIPKKVMVPEQQKKVVPLSRLVLVSGSLQNDKKSNADAVQVVLHNNSAETLKSVAVRITYLKKENREIGSETVYFYNVAPAASPVATVSGNRRATSARFEIGTITRSDGSLYLIH